MDIELYHMQMQSKWEIQYNKNDIERVRVELAEAKKNGEKINEEIIKLYNETILKNRKNRKINTEQKEIIALIEYYNEQRLRLESIQLVGLILSSVYMITGFFLWYWCVQRPLDNSHPYRVKNTNKTIMLKVFLTIVFVLILIFTYGNLYKYLGL